MAIPSRAQRVRGAPAPRTPTVEVDWGLGYEALIGLALLIGGEPESTYEVGEKWFKDVRRKASPELRSAARKRAGSEGYILVGLAGMARESGGRSVSALVARMRKDVSSQVKLGLLRCESRLEEPLLRGDPAAVSEYLKSRHKGEREVARRLLAADPRDLAIKVADLLERWDTEIFSEIGVPLESELKTSAQVATRLAQQMPADRLVVRVTRGVEYRTEPWITSIVLVPTVLNRPWVDITEDDGTKYFFYPAGPAAATPDMQLVQVYKALGDETRLRILRLLSTGEANLSEIAEKLGLAKSTVHQHMVVLRLAGLTRSVVGAGGKGYVLNDRPDLNSLLDGFLKS